MCIVRCAFKRRTTVLRVQFKNVNLVVGSTCEAGCRAIVRIQLDQLKADGTLDRLEKPLTIFTGLQFEQHIKEVPGEVLIVGDCAKGMLERFPNAKYWGDCQEYPNCTPIWANRPDIGIANYVRTLTQVHEGAIG